MKEFVKSLLTNRLGLIFGILILCCIPLYKFFTDYFSLPVETKLFLEHAFTCVNLPAMIFSFIFGVLAEAFFPIFRQFPMEAAFLPIFILVQWLLIGRFSKYLASEFTGK